MYKHCTTEKTIMQQQIVKSCLLDAMQKHYYNEITVTGLCEQAGITRRIFYRLFDTKDDALYALIDHTLMEFITIPHTAEKDPIKIKENIRDSFQFWLNKRTLLDALQKNDAMSLLLERAILHITYNDLDAIRLFGAANNVNARQIILFCITGITSLIVDWHNSNYEKSLEEMVEIEYQLLTSPHILLSK